MLRRRKGGPIYFLLMGMVLVLLLSGCNNAENRNEKNNGKINIVTTIAQIGEPISVIGGDHVNVTSLMGPGVDPHLYNATQGDIATLNDADIIFYNGLNLEGNMNEIFKEIGKTKPTLGIAETVAENNLLEDPDKVGALDPHIWFDIDLWKGALNGAVALLIEHYPEIEDDLIANRDAYFAELDTLKKEAIEKLAEIPEEQRILVTAHDAFGYFGAAYDIEVIGLQGLSTDDEVGLSDIQSTIDIIVEHNVPAVFIETSINESSIQAVIEGAREAGVDVELGGELFSDAMGEAGTEEGTYLGMYRHNVETIYNALMRK